MSGGKPLIIVISWAWAIRYRPSLCHRLSLTDLSCTRLPSGRKLDLAGQRPYVIPAMGIAHGVASTVILRAESPVYAGVFRQSNACLERTFSPQSSGGMRFLGRCPDRYTHLMIVGPPSWSRPRPHDGSRGFQPTGGIIQMRLRRGATLETGGSDPEPPHQASRRDANTSRPLNRGLKPTATFAKSLRDRERTTYDPYHEGNCSSRDVYKDQGVAQGWYIGRPLALKSAIGGSG
jgi:hypothetical protein